MTVPAAATGGVLVALTAVRELTMSVLLVAPGTQTLGVSIFNLQQAGDYNAASALSLLVALVGIAGLGLFAGTRAVGDRVGLTIRRALFYPAPTKTDVPAPSAAALAGSPR